MISSMSATVAPDGQRRASILARARRWFAGRTSKRAHSSGAQDTFQGTIDEARESASSSAEKLGFVVQRSEATYLEAKRPQTQKCIEGGETIGVWFKPDGTRGVRVLVKTVKSLPGLDAQRNWDQDILRGIERECHSP